MLDFYVEKKYPPIQELRDRLVNNLNDFPQVSLYILKNMIKTMSFKYKKLKRKPCLMESSKVVSSRLAYLRNIRYYRSQNFPIYYLDET